MILLNSSLIYIMFGILLQFFVEVKSQAATFKRMAHSNTLINNKLYILGGGVPPANKAPPKDTFLYLDVSVPFDTNGLNWNDLSATTNNIVPPHAYASAIKGGANNDTLFLYGGDNFGGQTLDFVYTFNTQNNAWSGPKINGVPPNAKEAMTPIVDYNGLMYLFGGLTSASVSAIYTNDMFILDTINLSWKKASSINAPRPMVSYGAVFLPNKNIMYIGGFNQDIGTFSLNEVYLYDTTNDIWTIKPTNGLIPSPRYAFSSTLGLDGQRVIIFGGFQDGGKLDPANSLYELDLNNFNWYIPKVTGGIPSNRAFHRAVLVGKYIIITFGRDYVENDILLLDISDKDQYIWTTNFKPSPPVSSPSVPITTSTQPITANTSPSKSNNTGIIVGAFIGSLIGGISLTVGSFFLYKWYKNKGQNVIRTPGEGGDNYPQEILQIPGEHSTYYKSQQAILSPPIQPTYNHGQEAVDSQQNDRKF